jgi:hypothetical protein
MPGLRGFQLNRRLLHKNVLTAAERLRAFSKAQLVEARFPQEPPGGGVLVRAFALRGFEWAQTKKRTDSVENFYFLRPAH